MMTDSLFKSAAIALYGADAWSARLGDALGVAPRSVQRWASGTRDIPPEIWAQLQSLLAEHVELCRELSQQIGAR